MEVCGPRYSVLEYGPAYAADSTLVTEAEQGTWEPGGFFLSGLGKYVAILTRVEWALLRAGLRIICRRSRGLGLPFAWLAVCFQEIHLIIETWCQV